MSLTHTQQVQRLYRSALRTAFDWAYHRYRHLKNIFRGLCDHVFFSGTFLWQRHRAYVACSRHRGTLPVFISQNQLHFQSGLLTSILGMLLTDQLSSKLEPFISRSPSSFNCLVFPQCPCSDYFLRYQHADPYHSSPSPLILVRFLMISSVPYVEGSTKWQRNIPPPASVRPPSPSCIFLSFILFTHFQICGHDDHSHGHH